MTDNEYILDPEELSAPKPYKPERKEETDEINSEIANLFHELFEMGAIL